MSTGYKPPIYQNPDGSTVPLLGVVAHVRTLQLVDGVLTVPGAGKYLVLPETGPATVDDLDTIVDECLPGERIVLVAYETCAIQITENGNLSTPTYMTGLHLGKGNVAGSESDVSVCELVKGTDGLWQVFGSGSDKDIRAEHRMFVELDGAGTYTATIDLPAHATVLDMRFSSKALWTATTSATLNVGDADDPDGYFSGVDLKTTPAANVNGAGGISSFLGGVGAAYTPTNVTPDRAFDADSTNLDEIADVLGTLLSDLKKTTGAGAYAGFCKYSSNYQTITATIVTVGATGHAGDSRLTVIYAVSQGVTADKA